MSAAEINSKIAEAITAQEAGDFATAISKFRSAQIMIAASPDIRHGSEEIRYTRDQLSAVLQELKRAQTSQNSGIRTQLTRYVNPGCEE